MDTEEHGSDTVVEDEGLERSPLIAFARATESQPLGDVAFQDLKACCVCGEPLTKADADDAAADSPRHGVELSKVLS